MGRKKISKGGGTGRCPGKHVKNHHFFGKTASGFIPPPGHGCYLYVFSNKIRRITVDIAAATIRTEVNVKKVSVVCDKIWGMTEGVDVFCLSDFDSWVASISQCSNPAIAVNGMTVRHQMWNDLLVGYFPLVVDLCTLHYQLDSVRRVSLRK